MKNEIKKAGQAVINAVVDKIYRARATNVYNAGTSNTIGDWINIVRSLSRNSDVFGDCNEDIGPDNWWIDLGRGFRVFVNGVSKYVTRVETTYGNHDFYYLRFSDGTYVSQRDSDENPTLYPLAAPIQGSYNIVRGSDNGGDKGALELNGIPADLVSRATASSIGSAVYASHLTGQLNNGLFNTYSDSVSIPSGAYPIASKISNRSITISNGTGTSQLVFFRATEMNSGTVSSIFSSIAVTIDGETYYAGNSEGYNSGTNNAKTNTSELSYVFPLDSGQSKTIQVAFYFGGQRYGSNVSGATVSSFQTIEYTRW